MSPLFIINLIIITISLYIVFQLIQKYNMVVFDRYQFEYYALRDRLAMKVVKGELDENSWVYRHVVDAINYHIKTVESVSMIRVIEFLVEYHIKKSEKIAVDRMVDKVEDKEVLSIMYEFMELTGKLLYRNSRVQMIMWDFLIKIIPSDKQLRRIIPESGSIRQIEKTAKNIESNKNVLEEAILNKHGGLSPA